MEKYRSENLAPAGHRCPLCGERRRRNLVFHEPSGEYICQPCQEAVATLPSWKQDLKSLRGAYSRRLGGS
jgi:DNA-directed RNA polymerase subunit RPC12/RpoP